MTWTGVSGWASSVVASTSVPRSLALPDTSSLRRQHLKCAGTILRFGKTAVIEPAVFCGRYPSTRAAYLGGQPVEALQ